MALHTLHCNANAALLALSRAWAAFSPGLACLAISGCTTRRSARSATSRAARAPCCAARNAAHTAHLTTTWHACTQRARLYTCSCYARHFPAFYRFMVAATYLL